MMCVIVAMAAAASHAGQGPDLSVTYTDGVTHIAPGATLTYTLTVTNNSATAATNASATATLPNVLSFTSASNGGTFANGVVTFSNLAVPANSALQLQFNAAVINPLAAGTALSYTSTATAIVDPVQGVDPVLGNNSTTDTNTLDAFADPVICTLTDGLGCAFANGLLTYTAEACNIGNIGITGVVVKNTIPVGTTFVSADNGGTFLNGVVTWPTYSIPGGVHTFRSVTVKVSSPLPVGVTQLVDSSVITDDGANGVDANPGNNFITDTDCILPSVALVITKTVDISNPNIGDAIVYSVVVKNNGPDNASNVTVTELIPSSLTLISATQTAGMYDSQAGLWTVGALVNGASATLTITATVNVNPPVQINNTACVSNAPEVNSNAALNCATVTIIPGCSTKPIILSGPTATPAQAILGEPQTFTVTATNSGNVPLTITWDFGDGIMGTGATVQHSYPIAGSYTVKVTVANACGGLGASAQLAIVVPPANGTFQCSLLKANFNLARVNSDSLSLLAQFSFQPGFNPAGQKVFVQIQNYLYSATLDSHGKFIGFNQNVSIKPFGNTYILALKVSRASLRTALLPGLGANVKSATISAMPFVINIGSQSYSKTFDTYYTAKNSAAKLTK